jgi:hypothetical protein
MAITSRSLSLQRIKQSFGIVDQVQASNTLRTYASQVIGMVRIPEELDEALPVQVGIDATACRTLFARRGDDPEGFK